MVSDFNGDVSARLDRLAEEMSRLRDIVETGGDYTQPILSGGEPKMITVESLTELDRLDPQLHQFFDVAVKGPPDITFKSLRDVDGDWSWRLLSTGRFPFAEQGRDYGAVGDFTSITRSVTDFETILSADLATPILAQAFGLITFTVLIANTAPAGTGNKEVRLVFNETEVVGTVSLGASDAGFFAMFIVGPLPAWGVRSVEGVNATWNSIAFSTTVESIESVQLQARTQDENGGDDVVWGGNLIVYA